MCENMHSRHWLPGIILLLGTLVDIQAVCQQTFAVLHDHLILRAVSTFTCLHFLLFVEIMFCRSVLFATSTEEMCWHLLHRQLADWRVSFATKCLCFFKCKYFLNAKGTNIQQLYYVQFVYSHAAWVEKNFPSRISILAAHTIREVCSDLSCSICMFWHRELQQHTLGWLFTK